MFAPEARAVENWGRYGIAAAVIAARREFAKKTQGSGFPGLEISHVHVTDGDGSIIRASTGVHAANHVQVVVVDVDHFLGVVGTGGVG